MDNEAVVATDTSAPSTVEPAAPAAAPEAPAAPVERRAVIEAAIKAKSASDQTPAAMQGEKKEVISSPEAKSADTRPRDDLGRFKMLPKSWKKELAPKYETLDPEVQAEIYRREDDVFKGIEQYKSKAALAQEFEQAIQPYSQTLQQLGVSPIAAVKALMQADHTLRHGTMAQKQAVLMDVIRTYGVDYDSSNPPAQADPATAELQTVRQELAALRQAQEQSALTPYLNAVTQFRSDPAHEHYDQLENHILSLISSGAANDLQEAYDQALWAHPELRQQALARQQAQDREAEAAKVAAARAAGVQVRGAPSQSIPATINPQDRRAVIKAAVAGLQR
jgi:hypothetical protein